MVCTILNWFTFYLSSRSQAVSINDSISAFSSLFCGEPQGYVIGPLLFTLYTTPLGSMISKKIPSNTICTLMTPSCTSLSLLQILLYVLKHLPPLSLTFFPGWTWTNCSSIHLKLNFFSMAQNNSVSNFLILQTYLSAMISSQSVPLLAILASSLTPTCLFSEQINSVSKSCHFHIRDIHRIRHLLPLSAATALANPLVSSKLDYCNSLYSDISQSNLNKLQRIQNLLARVITNTAKYQHITPTLKPYTGFQSNKESITHSVFSHAKHKSTTYISLQ